MSIVIEGRLDAKNLRVAIIVARFNSFVTERLLDGARDALTRHGAADDDLTIVRTPGSFEIPAVLDRLVSDTASYDAVLCLGAVIRGGTPHFDYVAAEVSKGIAQIATHASMPIGFGVLTCDTMEQAIERAGGKAGNKGFEAALSVIEMANLFRSLPRKA